IHLRLSYLPNPTISSLSLHDALPILHNATGVLRAVNGFCDSKHIRLSALVINVVPGAVAAHDQAFHCPLPHQRAYERDCTRVARSEEHTSELQSPDHLVCRLLLETQA